MGGQVTFTAILRDASDRELLRVSAEGNGRFLMQEAPGFQLLSELDPYSYDVFSSEKASQLQRELMRVREILESPVELAHLDALIKLAGKSADTAGSMVIFTPFEQDAA